VIARQKPKTDPISPAKPAPARSRIDVDATTGQAWEQATGSSHHKSDEAKLGEQICHVARRSLKPYGPTPVLLGF
jgi:hypothetical protein